MKKRYLILQDGTVFEGTAIGADASSVGELVFTTGMAGYLETLTDPSYFGQIVMQTFPLIGNYGVIPADFEGECCVKGYVVRELCDAPSNFRSEDGLNAFLKEKGVAGICGVDTRHITRIIRESGVMNAMISDSPEADLAAIADYRISDAVMSVTSKVKEVFSAGGEARFKVALIDYGAKRNIVRELAKRDCEVHILRADASAESILATGYDGVMLSNGPGDPQDNAYQIEQIARLKGRLPIFGICLGHQLLALASGANTVKLKYGHRGVNQPVKDVLGTRTYITSQNHGYAVDAASIKSGRVSFINANDSTCEGIDYPEDGAFSVQFHPEACSGPHDTSFLFDRFMGLMEENGNASR